MEGISLEGMRWRLPRSWRGMMSLNVLIAVCVVSMDFLLYVLFQWTYAD